MSMPKVNREYKKLFRLYKRVDIEREIILISDSKGLTIKKHNTMTIREEN